MTLEFDDLYSSETNATVYDKQIKYLEAREITSLPDRATPTFTLSTLGHGLQWCLTAACYTVHVQQHTYGSFGPPDTPQGQLPQWTPTVQQR
jgi:hypothetical protein